MKNVFLTLLLGFCLTSCIPVKREMTVTVSNFLDFDRTGELVEVDMEEITRQLKLSDTTQIVITDSNGLQVPYQLTYDNRIIFPASVKAGGQAVYAIAAGTPNPFGLIACGRRYPERLDDLAWENDLTAFRAYGPALQARGEKAFGYDVFTKYNTTEPVVEERYAMEVDPQKWKRIHELRKTDPQAADELLRSKSYHVDHGNGMDCYAVGATLGGGAAALMDADTLIYPYCYRTCEILDNGPLRFTARLEYTPLTVRGDSSVIETRIISLDAGSYLNKTAVSYSNLKETMPIAVGIVIHDTQGSIAYDKEAGYMTYVDPTTDASGACGKMFMGAAFPKSGWLCNIQPFTEEEKKGIRKGAEGHLLGIGKYSPGETYTYYWGSAWNKAAIKTSEAWGQYMSRYMACVRNPLEVKVND